jgi:peroxiredoxin Q/BCP
MAHRSTWTSGLKPGMKAPEFQAILDDGSTLSSKTLRGKPLVLFFYNHDGTETCTVEACNLRDHYQQLLRKGFQVIGVSEDSVRKHQGFKKKYKLPYPLISDPENALAKLFDVFGEKHFMGRVSDTVHRTTFVIGADWKIQAVIHPVVSADHAAQILAL